MHRFGEIFVRGLGISNASSGCAAISLSAERPAVTFDNPAEAKKRRAQDHNE